MSNVRIGRYEIITQIASGGMASIHLAKVVGAGGFNRLVALKRLHPHSLSDERIVSMFVDEARLAARIFHPNVISTLDLEQVDREFFIVMEYIEGNGLNKLLERSVRFGKRLPTPVILRIMIDVLHGLHAAHELRDDEGTYTGLVHRDVSPHNVLVGVDGLARIGDFGVAHVKKRFSSTRSGELKGKFAYMAPEQISSRPIDRRTDIFACGVVLWESLAGRRLFLASDSVAKLLMNILHKPLPDLRKIRPNLDKTLFNIIYKALQRNPENRYDTAKQFAEALEFVGTKVGISDSQMVGKWVTDLSETHLRRLRNATREEFLPSESPSTPVNLKNKIPQEQLDSSNSVPSAILSQMIAIDTPPAFPVSTKTRTKTPWLLSGEESTRIDDLPLGLWHESTSPGLGPAQSSLLRGKETSPGASLLSSISKSALIQEQSQSSLSPVPAAEDYLEHFSLLSSPFSEIRQSHFFWRGGPFGEVIEKLRKAIDYDRDPLLLLGTSGSGRTFSAEILRYIISGLKVFVVDSKLLFGASPLHELCRRLGVQDLENVSTGVLMGRFLTAVAKKYPETSRVLIVLDDFSKDDPDVLEDLMRLRKAQPSRVHLMLTGNLELPEQLWGGGASEFLLSRGSQVNLRALSPKEVMEYISFRLRVASEGRFRGELQEAASQFLYARSHGLPRLLNIYLHNALCIAYLRQVHQLSVEVLRIAMKKQNYLSLPAASELLTLEGSYLGSYLG